MVEPVKVEAPADVLNVPAKPVPVEPVVAKPAPKPMPAPKPVVENNGIPVRVVDERRDVTFNPENVVAEQPKPVVVQPAPKPVAQPAAKPTPVAKPAPKPVAKPAQKAATAPRGSWYVQFGSYSSRALAESAERQMRAGHQSLFEGKQFVILAAQLPNGKTTYRLRVAFNSSNDANGFCQNAKSDGLDCYVAK